MPGSQGKKGKRSKTNKPANVRYRLSNRKNSNKLHKLEALLARYERLGIRTKEIPALKASIKRISSGG